MQLVRRFSNKRIESRVAEVFISNSLPQHFEKHEKVLRSKVTIDSSISQESLEHEFRVEIAGALGRMDKILLSKLDKLKMEDEKLQCSLLEIPRNIPNLRLLVEKFNYAQKEAYDARFNLICQRQSAGFSIDNAILLMRRYPIPARRRLKEDT
jgi:hypothetical protein